MPEIFFYFHISFEKGGNIDLYEGTWVIIGKTPKCIFFSKILSWSYLVFGSDKVRISLTFRAHLKLKQLSALSITSSVEYEKVHCHFGHLVHNSRWFRTITEIFKKYHKSILTMWTTPSNLKMNSFLCSSFLHTHLFFLRIHFLHGIPGFFFSFLFIAFFEKLMRKLLGGR